MVTFSEWFQELRRLHGKAREGELEGDALRAYLAARDQLLHGLLVAQQITREFGHAARETVRIAWALQVDIGCAASCTRAVTLDVSAGGFSVLLGAPPAVGDELDFSLRLPQATAIRGRARTVAALSRSGAFRVSFAISELAPPDREKLETILFDRIVSALAAGTTIAPAADAA